MLTEDRLSMERVRAAAEKIVREYGSTDCLGGQDYFAPYCSCAPYDTPLCPSCEALCSAIEAIIRTPREVPGKLLKPWDEWMRNRPAAKLAALKAALQALLVEMEQRFYTASGDDKWEPGYSIATGEWMAKLKRLLESA